MKTNSTLIVMMLCVICAATLMSGCMESDDANPAVDVPSDQIVSEVDDKPDEIKTVPGDVGSMPVTVTFSEDAQYWCAYSRIIMMEDGTAEVYDVDGEMTNGIWEFSEFQMSHCRIYIINGNQARVVLWDDDAGTAKARRYSSRYATSCNMGNRS